MISINWIQPPDEKHVVKVLIRTSDVRRVEPCEMIGCAAIKSKLILYSEPVAWYCADTCEEIADKIDVDAVANAVNAGTALITVVSSVLRTALTSTLFSTVLGKDKKESAAKSKVDCHTCRHYRTPSEGFPCSACLHAGNHPHWEE